MANRNQKKNAAGLLLLCISAVIALLLACSESHTTHDGSYFEFEGDNHSPEIPAGAIACEIKKNTLVEHTCAVFSGLLLKGLAKYCAQLQGMVKMDCNEFLGKSRCVADAGTFGKIVFHGVSSDECTKISHDPLATNATVSYEP